MKFQVICLIVLVAFATAENSMLSNQAQMAARAGDAVDSALDVLKGLKQSNVDEQKKADAINKTKESAMKLEIEELLDLADGNKEQAQKETDHVKFLKSEMEKTGARLSWIHQRKKELKRKRGELQDQRCAASMAFVKALKEHMEALNVIRMLKSDAKKAMEKKAKEESGLIEMGSNYEKLGQYAHLFNERAMRDFAELSGTAKKGEKENKFNGVFAEQKTGEKKERVLRFVDMLAKLEKELENSIAELKEGEIKSAYDLISWLTNSQKELEFLKSDQKEKIAYIDKCGINIIGAKAREDRLWNIYFESASTYNDATAARKEIRKEYMEEKARRLEENLVLDGVIQMFIKQVAIINKKLREAANDAKQGKKSLVQTRVDSMEIGTRKTLNQANKFANLYK